MGTISDEAKQVGFMLLYEPVHQRLSRYCQVQTKSYEEAQDLVSETVLKAYEGFEKLRDKETFLYFLFGIARNILLQKRRKEKLMSVFRQSRNSSSMQVNSQGPANVDFLFLHHALNELPAQQRDAIILFEISGFSLKEIAELQGTSLSNVKQRLLRARVSLKKLLGDQESIQKVSPVPHVHLKQI